MDESLRSKLLRGIVLRLKRDMLIIVLKSVYLIAWLGLGHVLCAHFSAAHSQVYHDYEDCNQYYFRFIHEQNKDQFLPLLESRQYTGHNIHQKIVFWKMLFFKLNYMAVPSLLRMH